MSNFSYWERKYFWDESDFIVVGGGITGLTTAWFLKQAAPKSSVKVLERGVLPSGASTKNAGFACFGSMSEILSDITSDGEDAVFSLIDMRLSGLARLRTLLGDAGIGYEPCGGYEIFTGEGEERYRECKNALDLINRRMAPLTGKHTFRNADADAAKFGFGGVRHMIRNSAEGLIDTGLMMRSLTAKVRNAGADILNGVTVTGTEADHSGVRVYTDCGELKAGRVCIAVNGFAQKLLPDLDVKPCRAQVIVTEPIAKLQVKGAFHHNCGYDYFRHLDGRILLGGGRNLDSDAETTDDFGTTAIIQDYLDRFLREIILPGRAVKTAMRYSGIMGIGSSKKLIIEKVAPNLVCAVRFGGMGVALGTAAGNTAAELLTE